MPLKSLSGTVSILHARALSAGARRGILSAGNLRVTCMFGRSGRSSLKREGDGTTPRGVWPLRRVLVRPGIRAPGRLPSRVMRRDDGWCDDPNDRNYNLLVKLPYSASHEALWREDELYDIVVVLGYNDRSRKRRAGSAVFLHLADAKGGPTAGCIAVSRRDMMKLLPLCGQRTCIKVW